METKTRCVGLCVWKRDYFLPNGIRIRYTSLKTHILTPVYFTEYTARCQILLANVSNVTPCFYPWLRSPAKQRNVSIVVRRRRLNGVENIEDVELPCRHLVNGSEVGGCSCWTMRQWGGCRRRPRCNAASRSNPPWSRVRMMTNRVFVDLEVGSATATESAWQRCRRLECAVVQGLGRWLDSKPGRGWRPTNGSSRHRRGVEGLPKLGHVTAVCLPLLTTKTSKSPRMNCAVVGQCVTATDAPIGQPLAHLLDADPASRC